MDLWPQGRKITRTRASFFKTPWYAANKEGCLVLSKLWQHVSLFHRVALSTGAVVACVIGALLFSIIHSQLELRREEFAVRVSSDLMTLVPTIAEQAVLGDYTAIQQMLTIHAERPGVERVTWEDAKGNLLAAAGKAVPS